MYKLASTGISEIDADHIIITAHIQKIINNLFSNNDISDDYEELKILIKEHFESEEKIFKELNTELYEKHKILHETILDKLNNISTLSFKETNAVFDLISQHTYAFDTQCKDFIKVKNLIKGERKS